MKKNLQIVFSAVFLSFNAQAQCPYIVGMLADAETTGIPSGEGKNEFMAFNTGGSSIAVNTLFFSYGINTTTTNFSIDGTTVAPSVWTSLATPSLITNSIGTITVVTSGSIPANKNVVVIASTNAVSYDLRTFGTDVYVLPYNASSGSPRVVGYTAAGNFANSGGALRYLRIRQGATCRDTVSYTPSSLPGTDGGGAKWTAAKVITYVNSGSSGAVLPINLLSFDVQKYFQKAQIKWTTSGNSTEQYFEIERSSDGVIYSKIAVVPSKKDNNGTVKEYSFSDKQTTDGEYYYRIRMIDVDGSSSFSPTNKISFENASTQQTNLYPNPVNNQLFFSNTKGFTAAIIVDFMGKIVLEQSVQIGNNILELGNLPKGFYLLQLKSSAGIENHKIIKE